MKVRFGFVAMALSLKNASPSKTMTVKTFHSISDTDAALEKATRIAKENLHNTLRILRHAHASGVELYRFSSKLIPLYGLPETKHWDFLGKIAPSFHQIGDFVKSTEMRVSFHPDHYVVLNSKDQDIFKSAIDNLQYHVDMYEAMGLEEGVLVLHVGGGYRDKTASLARFAENWGHVPTKIRRRIVLENDDKLYTARMVQGLANEIGVPMVLDVHHHRCNHEDEVSLADVVVPFLASWQSTGLPPKAHVSSPKSEPDLRAHADNINPEDILPFLDLVRETNTDIDVMIEAKRKDEALFDLVQDLGRLGFVRVLSPGVIEYRP